MEKIDYYVVVTAVFSIVVVVIVGIAMFEMNQQGAKCAYSSYETQQAVQESCKPCEDIVESMERAKMCNRDIKPHLRINGFFIDSQYYCIWTEGRNESQIASTVVHEQCHALVNHDYDHFCLEE